MHVYSTEEIRKEIRRDHKKECLKLSIGMATPIVETNAAALEVLNMWTLHIITILFATAP